MPNQTSIIPSQKTTFIYGLWDPRNYQLRYIGKSDNPERRLKEHIKDSSHLRGRHIYHWINSLLRNGLEPSLEILEEVAIEHWEETERQWIRDCKKFGLSLVNSTDGGEGVSGWSPSEQRRKDIGDFFRNRPSHRKGKKLPPEHIEKIKNAMQNYIGIPRPEEVRKKIGKSHEGKTISEETRLKMRKASKGRGLGIKKSEEHKRKIGDAQLGPKNHRYGKKLTEEQKKKLDFTGKKHSEETRKKMSEARKKYWENKRNKNA